MSIENPIVDQALKLLGVPSCLHNTDQCKQDPYNHGLNPNQGLDCSGFVKYVLLHADLPHPELMSQLLAEARHCNELYQLGLHVHLGLQRPGDIVYFTRAPFVRPTHIGIMVDPENYIHAPGKNDTVITVTSLKPEILPVTGLPAQLYTHNPIGFRRMAYKEKRHWYPFC